MGGSAIPGGRTQKYMYDGSLKSMKTKIFPHEFMHNFGTGHAFAGGQTYGDNYDITGGAVAPNGDVSLASKHRFKWVDDAQVAVVTPATLPRGTAKQFTIRPFDNKDAPSSLGNGEVLGVRLDTRFMGTACPKGEFAWCPDWGSYNGQNPWVPCSTCKGSDHYLWVSYRTRDTGGDGKHGASLHASKQSANGWVDATAFLDVRPASSGQDDAFLKAGETFVFDGNSGTAIVVKAVSVANQVAGQETLVIEVSYVDGVKAAVAFEQANSEHICAHTLGCGAPVDVRLSGGVAVSGSGGKTKSVLVRIGEAHETSAKMRACAEALPGIQIFLYDAFPAAQALHQAPLAIGATSTLSDFCAAGGYPATLHSALAGIWWLEAAEFRLAAMEHFTIGTDMKMLTVPGSSFPHYIASLHTGGTVHLHMVECLIYYCKKDEYKAFNGGGGVTGWQWVLSYGSNPNSGTGWEDYLAPVDAGTKDSVFDPTKLGTKGVKWVKSNGGSVPTTVVDPKLAASTHAKETVGRHGSGRKWLAAAYNVDGGGVAKDARLKLSLAATCHVAECAQGHWRKTSSTSAHAGTACAATCEACPQGTTSWPGFIGAQSCYWDAPKLQVTVNSSSTKASAKNGVYVKRAGETHGGLPYYEKEDSSHQGGGVLLRRDRFNGWVLTVGGNFNDGSGYGGDGQANKKCTACAVAAFPQLIATVPDCNGCDATWTFSNPDNAADKGAAEVTITEVGTPPSAAPPKAGDAAQCKLDSATWHSRAGTSEYCADPSVVSKVAKGNPASTTAPDTSPVPTKEPTKEPIKEPTTGPATGATTEASSTQSSDKVTGAPIASSTAPLGQDSNATNATMAPSTTKAANSCAPFSRGRRPIVASTTALTALTAWLAC